MDTKKIAQQLGKLGGLKTKSTQPADYYKQLSAKGVKARAKKKALSNLIDVTKTP